VRIGRGELDLVASIDGELVAVEVKAASVGPGNDPIHHFDDAKQYQVRALATQRRIYRVDYVGVAVSAAGVTVRWLPRVC
jgi:Holliday junction resolvase-like predicted endonuclease